MLGGDWLVAPGDFVVVVVVVVVVVDIVGDDCGTVDVKGTLGLVYGELLVMVVGAVAVRFVTFDDVDVGCDEMACVDGDGVVEGSLIVGGGGDAGVVVRTEGVVGMVGVVGIDWVVGSGTSVDTRIM